MRYFVTVETSVYELLIDDSNNEIIGKIHNDANDLVYEFTSNDADAAKQIGLDFITDNYGTITTVDEQEFDNT